MSRDESTLSAEERAALLRSVENVQAAAVRQLRGQPDAVSVIRFVNTVQRGVDKVVQTRAQNGVKPDCQSGCSHCCSARVEALPAEAFQIAHQVSRRADAARADVIERLRAQAALPDEALSWKQRPACAFLVAGLCSVYDLRPAVCRKAHSLDVRRCEAGSAEIPEDLGLVLDAEALIKGASSAYAELGFEAQGVELARGVLLALSDPTAEARWSNGERVFFPDDDTA
jgi:Fe-S-cluster containining protein